MCDFSHTVTYFVKHNIGYNKQWCVVHVVCIVNMRGGGPSLLHTSHSNDGAAFCRITLDTCFYTSPFDHDIPCGPKKWHIFGI